MAPTTPSQPLVGARIGAYRVVGELGRGGMATVLEVEHEPSGERRALKLLLPLARAEEAARRMEREFLTLSRLRHPAVLKVHECGVYEGRPWFVTEKLVGMDLREAVEQWRALAPAARFRRAEGVLVQVAQALAYIHDQGLVHRDVTPGNIMLLDDGSVRLMDFGVVKEPGTDMTVHGEVVGTIAYIAPEQITGGPVDARADLYALGAVLYLMLTGRRPFNARNLAGYLDKHLNRAPRPPHELAPTLPDRLDQACMRLLEKEPDARFASARHLLLALDDAPRPDALLGSVTGDPGHLPITGRSLVLATLREAVTRLVEPPGGRRATSMTGPTDEGRAAPRPPGGLIVLDGGDGTGKSRLLAETAAMARQMDVAVTRLRGTGDPRPWSAFRALAEKVAQLPGMVLPAAVRRALDGISTAERRAVSRAVEEMTRASGPRVLLIDDAGRIDRASMELVAWLLRNLAGSERFPLLVVLTRDPAEGESAVGQLLHADLGGIEPVSLPLPPLQASAVEELLLHLVIDGPATRALAARLAVEGQGNAFFIAQMLRGLVDSEVIELAPDGGRGVVTLDLAELSRAPLPVPGTIRQALLARLGHVGPDSRAVLDLMALAREPVEVEVLRQASTLPEERLRAALAALVAGGMITSHEAGGDRPALARHRLADVLVEALDEARRRDLHGRLARALERHHRRALPAVTVAVAEHFAAAERPAVAWPYLLAAAEQRQGRGEIGEALALVERGLQLEPRAREQAPLDEADRRLGEALRLRATLLIHLGRWEEAQQEASAALDLARERQDPLSIARAATELGALYRRRHDVAEAARWLELALAHAPPGGERALQQARLPALYELGALHWARGDLDTARSHWVETLSTAELLGDERALALGANGLGVLALCRGDAAEARRRFERAIEVCEAHGMAERLVISRINLTELHHLTGNLRKGADLADRTVAEAREVGHLYGVALGLRYRALVLADLGRLPEARENALEGARIQASLGNPEEELSSWVMAARVAIYDGELGLLQRALDAVEPLLEQHDTEGYGPIVHAWRARLLLALGDEPGARQALARAEAAVGRGWPHQRIRVLLNTARVYEVLGEGERAAALAEEALRLADASGYRLYAMRSRQVAGRTSRDEAARARHQRVADALARSLAANLPRTDGDAFLAQQPTLY